MTMSMNISMFVSMSEFIHVLCEGFNMWVYLRKVVNICVRIYMRMYVYVSIYTHVHGF